MAAICRKRKSVVIIRSSESTATGNSYTDTSGGSGAALLKAVEAFPYDKYPESIIVASWHIDSEFASSWRNV